MGSSQDVAVGCKVSQETRTRLRMLAARRDTTMSALLREQIDDLLDAEDAPAPDEVSDTPQN